MFFYSKFYFKKNNVWSTWQHFPLSHRKKDGRNNLAVSQTSAVKTWYKNIKGLFNFDLKLEGSFCIFSLYFWFLVFFFFSSIPFLLILLDISGQIDKGYMSPNFITNHDKSIVELKMPNSK